MRNMCSGTDWCLWVRSRARANKGDAQDVSPRAQRASPPGATKGAYMCERSHDVFVASAAARRLRKSHGPRRHRGGSRGVSGDVVITTIHAGATPAPGQGPGGERVSDASGRIGHFGVGMPLTAIRYPPGWGGAHWWAGEFPSTRFVSRMRVAGLTMEAHGAPVHIAGQHHARSAPACSRRARSCSTCREVSRDACATQERMRRVTRGFALSRRGEKRASETLPT